MTDPKYMRRGLDFARGKMIEECGELQLELGNIQAALGKSLRWGWLSSNPEIDNGETNVEWVLRSIPDILAEMQDVREALDNLQKEIAINVPRPVKGRAAILRDQEVSPKPTPEEIADRDNALRSW